MGGSPFGFRVGVVHVEHGWNCNQVKSPGLVGAIGWQRTAKAPLLVARSYGLGFVGSGGVYDP